LKFTQYYKISKFPLRLRNYRHRIDNALGTISNFAGKLPGNSPSTSSGIVSKGIEGAGRHGYARADLPPFPYSGAHRHKAWGSLRVSVNDEQIANFDHVKETIIDRGIRSNFHPPTKEFRIRNTKID